MVGKTINHYRVLEKIGQGGMGEVYRAEDTSLKRDVAIKVLPEQFTKDPQRLARFEREAQLLASLNHPNIAAIHSFEHSDDIHFLVLELVPGETLAERVAKGPLPVEEALEVCRQIAEGVEAAHEKGVIHRDLKPANVKVTPEGKVKILDFGLAKAFEGETPVTDISQSPTLTEEMTRAGVILGTAAYMSPEQARGKPVDKRADIFAFGCVLYELLTGKRAFGGETVTDTLAAVLKSEPDWDVLPESTPWRIRELLRRCLQKELHLRVQHVGDARIDIHEADKDPRTTSPMGVTSAVRSGQQRWANATGLIVLTAIVTSLAIWILVPSTPSVSQPLKRFVITPPSTETLANFAGGEVAISPDGRRLVYVAQGETGSQLYLRSMDDLTTRSIPGTERVGQNPFFSPDGEWVAFFADGKLKKTSLTGGTPIILCDAFGSWSSGIWGSDDTIFFSSGQSLGKSLFRIAAAGGALEKLAAPETETGEVDYRYPEILPGGKALLFTVVFSFDNMQVDVLQLETGERKIVLKDARQAQYLPTGHLVFGQPGRGTGSLWAVPFDLETLEVRGDAVPVLDGIRQYPNFGVDYTLSHEGTLVYLPASAEGRKILWVNREGTEVDQVIGEPLLFPRYPRLSPDGRRLTLTSGQTGQSELWVYDLTGRPPYPLVLEGSGYYAIWTPDGTRVTFSSTPEGRFDLFWIPADGSTLDAELLLAGPNAQLPQSWSPDGQELIFLENSNFMALPVDSQSEPRLVVRQRAIGGAGQQGGGAAISPDGRWLAYVSDVTGEPEIWVRPYPGTGAPVRISANGGLEPVWAPEGKELFYLEGDRMMAAAVESGQEFRLQPPKVLFDTSYYHGNRPSYDVAPDGRFLMIKPSEGQQTAIHVVLNWFEELKRLVPTN